MINNSCQMFLSYLKIAWRSLMQDRQFTLLNLCGLAIGLACSLLIFLWVKDERQMDRFHQKDSRLFQVLQNIPAGDNTVSTIEATPALLAETLADQMPEVEEAVSVIPVSWFSSQGIVSFGNSHIKASEQYVSPNFFEVFSYQLLQGKKADVLRNKTAVVLSEDLALKLFHTTENLIGKIVQWDHLDSGTDFKGLYTITGIFQKAQHSTAQFDLLLPYEAFIDRRPGALNWRNSDPSTFLVLKQEADPDVFTQKIVNFNRETNKALYGKEANWIGTLQLQRYSERYLHGRFENGVPVGGRIAYVTLFSWIALFILVIACINFMNLSTAKASRRLKEIGIRKCVGADRGKLILQFLLESFLLTMAALLLALVLAIFSLPLFNLLTGKALSLQPDFALIISILGMGLVTALIAGSYPAFYLSGFKPVVVLKGKLQTSLGQVQIRKALVVFQFALAVVFIVAAQVIYKQMEYINNKELGFNKNNVISFKREGRLDENLSSFISEIRKIPGVVGASSFQHNLTGDHGGLTLKWEGMPPGQDLEFGNLVVDYELMDLLGFDMVEGRKFSSQTPADSSKVILNEAAIEAMGLADPLGTTVDIFGEKKQVIGVVKDFNFESLYEKVKPCILQCATNNNNILARIEPGSISKTLSSIEKVYKEFNADIPFEFRFLDEDYQQLYAPEQRLSVLSRGFAGMAIFISCLGLFGLATFSVQRRRKEIGIRKVVGAPVGRVVVMLSADFLKLVVGALVVALPVAVLLTNQWLQNFAFRIEIDLSIFVITVLAILLLTFLTISFHTIRAALANPVKSLRTE